jgi:hypothetical protein
MSTTQDFSKCIFNQRGKCDIFHSKKKDILQEMVKVSMLNGLLQQHGVNIGVDLSIFTERSLIMNRTGVSDTYTDNDVICPYHRYSCGTYWRSSKLCQSPYHDDQKPKATHSLPAEYYNALTEAEFFKDNKNYLFPIGQKVCRRCSTRIRSDCSKKKNTTLTVEALYLETRTSKIEAEERLEELKASTDTDSEFHFGNCSSNTVYTEERSLNDVNQLLKIVSENIKPLTYQIHQPVNDLSLITIRSLKRHYESILNEFSSFICEAIAPGQGENLIELFKANAENETEEELDPTMQSIVEAYKSAPNNKWRLFLLSTVPKQYTREKLQTIFACSRYMIDKSHYLRKQNDQFNIMNQNIIRRERLEKDRLDFFSISYSLQD